MLNPHAHPLHHESSHLRVGSFVIDVPRREVVSDAGSEPVRLTIKSLHVLLALVGQHGQVVSREALLEWVWPDTMPTDDVLTQAVGQLRRAFADDREAPRYVETISKGGYRLLAPVQWLPPEQAHAPPDANAGIAPQPVPDAQTAAHAPASAAVAVPAASTARRGWSTASILRIAVLTVALVGLLAYRWQGAPEPTPPATAGASLPATKTALEFVTITSRPGAEANPNLSPDGAMVAYQRHDAQGYGTIMLQTTAHVPPRALTTPPPGHGDSMPVWSRDGRRLAFVRYGPASRCQIMVIAPSGGAEQKLADCFAGAASSYDWTPDDSGLLMGMEVKPPEEASSPLRVLDIASGRWRVLPYTIAAGDIDSAPRYSPDGRWIVFRRNISLSDLWRMPAAGGVPERLTEVRGDIRGWDWLPDGSGLVFSFIGADNGLQHYDIDSGRITHLPMDVPATEPDIAHNSPSLVFTLDRSTAGIFGFSLPATPGAAIARRRLFPSSGSEMLPSVSPDGRTLAFLSDRGSRLEMWLAQVDDPESARPVAAMMPVPRHIAAWSRDSRRLLVIGSIYGRQVLYEVDAETGRSQRLPVPAPSPIYASYTDDADRVLVGSDSGEGRIRAVLYDRSAQPWRELATLQDVGLMRMDPGGRQFYFTRMSKPGTWRADLQLGNVGVVDAARPRFPREYKRWGIGADGVYYLDWSERCPTGWTRIGAQASPMQCLDAKDEAWSLTPSLDDSATTVYLTLSLTREADIGWSNVSAMTSGTAAMQAAAK